MAFTRSRFRRRFSRSFKRRGRIRPTTESGGRWERAYFNLGLTQDSINANAVQDGLLITGATALTNALAEQDPTLEPVGRLFQHPLRFYEVLAVQFDWQVWLGRPYASVDTDLGLKVTQVGIAVYTQRVDSGGSPVTLPPFHLSQWPVNQSTGLVGGSEDDDYATRTHFSRAGSLAPNTPAINVEAREGVSPNGGIAWRGFTKVRVRRRISDEYSLFLGLWNLGGLDSDTVQWFVNGSLWYRMRF